MEQASFLLTPSCSCCTESCLSYVDVQTAESRMETAQSFFIHYSNRSRNYSRLFGKVFLNKLVNLLVLVLNIWMENICSVPSPQNFDLVGIPSQKLQCTSSRVLSLRSHWILSRTLNVGLPNRFFPSRFATKIFCFHYFANSFYGHHLFVIYFMTLILV